MYGKLFQSMYDGTLATRGPWQALVTFQQLIVLCDKRGIIDMTAEAIARRTTIPLEMIEQGLSALQEPDEQSRTPTEEGRRIKLLSPNRTWGWQIINYEYYRQLRNEDERRDYHRQYYHTERKGKKANSQQSQQTQPIAVSSKQYAVSSKAIGRKSADEIVLLPDWLPDNWADYVAEREKSKHPMTARAAKAAISLLDRARGEGIDLQDVIAKSIAGGWRGLFPERGRKLVDGRRATDILRTGK